MDIEQELNALIGREGRYSNHSDDLGGETMWGITKREARADGYSGPMRDMPREVALGIYRRKYWLRPGYAEVAKVSTRVAFELLDTGVNMGVGKASEFLQIALNALNDQGALYADIAEDGEIGANTIAALRRFLAIRGKEGEAVLLTALNCLQGARYIEISRTRQANESFVYGWLKNRVQITHQEA